MIIYLKKYQKFIKRTVDTKLWTSIRIIQRTLYFILIKLFDIDNEKKKYYNQQIFLMLTGLLWCLLSSDENPGIVKCQFFSAQFSSIKLIKKLLMQ